MAIAWTRDEAGTYSTVIHGHRYHVNYRQDTRKWYLYSYTAERGIGVFDTKKAATTFLDVHARLTKDRTTEKSLKLERRSPKIGIGTELSIEGIRGRCTFVQYTRHASGAEWIDVLTSRGFSRTIDPAKIKTVHRKRKYS